MAGFRRSSGTLALAQGHTSSTAWEMKMSDTLIRTYDSLDAAQHVRDALLASGFSPDRIQLDAVEDEAGPTAGNFVLPEKDRGTGPGSERGGALSSFISTEERTQAYHTPNAQWRASCVLMVNAVSDEERARACDILDRFGAVDVDARTSARPH
jgi:hypothetical protein